MPFDCRVHWLLPKVRCTSDCATRRFMEGGLNGRAGRAKMSENPGSGVGTGGSPPEHSWSKQIDVCGVGPGVFLGVWIERVMASRQTAGGHR